jgi:pimeloyl-ACP methyl ester carboxylesterase
MDQRETSFIGRRIRHFEIVAKLGQGGMGTVYEAWDHRLGRRVAIKAIRSGVSRIKAARQRFWQEARTASQLGHPFICQVFDVMETSGQLLIVMERLEGETLKERLSRGRLPPHEALRMSIEVAEALRETHRHNIIHRDLKPSNVFVTDSGHVKLMDFGLARAIETTATPLPARQPGCDRETVADIASDDAVETVAKRLTQAGTLLGTIGYMAPEQVLGRTVDARVDIFALGTVIYESVAGAAPFPSRGLAEYFHELFDCPTPSLAVVAPHVPIELCKLVRALLAVDPAARPASMDYVYRMLVEIEADLGAGSAVPRTALRRAAHPRTQYVHSGEVSVAYQVIGSGPLDLVYVPGWITHLEYGWEEPRVAGFFERLASFSRVVLFDKRGTGMSDRVDAYPSIEQRMDDVQAVMDAVGSKRAAIFGMSEGGTMSMLFAATHPERTLALMLFGVFAKRLWSSDYPWAPTLEVRQAWFQKLAREWGGPVDFDHLAPSQVHDQEFRNWWATYLRLGASPGAALALARFNTQIDVRHVLPTIHVPTLVMGRTGDRHTSIAEERYIAEQIPGARFVELPGIDHLIYAGDVESVVTVAAQFLGELEEPEPPRGALVTLLCVMFPSADAQDLLHECVQELKRHRYRQVVTDCDRLVATFDGPGRAIQCACVLARATARHRSGVRAGIHLGECGTMGERLTGIPLQLAIALAKCAAFGQVLVTNAVRGLVVGVDIDFSNWGALVVPGIPGEWAVSVATLRSLTVPPMRTGDPGTTES